MKFFKSIYHKINMFFQKDETEFEKYMREDPTVDIHSFMINKFNN